MAISIRCNNDDSFVMELDKRGEDRSSAVRQTVERYTDLLNRARVALRDHFSAAELSLIVDASNGVIYDTWSIPALWMGIEDSIQLDRTDVKWSVDGPALVEKLKFLTPTECAAIVDATERFWRGVGKGEESSAEDLLQ